MNIKTLFAESESADKPLISCIVPAYNVTDYVERCIDSLLSQTYDNYEIIVVNDGSTDDTGEKIKKYSDNPKIRIIYQENQGLSAARNTGIKNATGSHLTFVDSDDWVDPDYFRAMVTAAVIYDADIVSVGNRICSDITANDIHDDDNVTFTDNLCADMLFSLADSNYAWAKLFKAELISEDFFPVGRTYEDVGSVYRAYDKCRRHAKVHGSYYFYFMREGSITSNRKISHVEDRYHFLEEMVKYPLRQEYKYWDFYVLTKTFATIADLFKVEGLPSDERKKFLKKIYKCVKPLKTPLALKYMKPFGNWLRVVSVKLHFSHILVKLKNR